MRLALLPRWIVASALLLGSSGCAGDGTPAHSAPHPSSGPSSGSSSSSPSVGAPTTTHDDVVATRDYSRWLLHAVPMPHGAREWHHSPIAHYRRGSVGIGPSDPAFTRTTWWTVPTSSAAFAEWLRGHEPHGLRAEDGGSAQAEGVWEEDVDFRAAGTAAHTPAWVNFAFLTQGDRLVVRVDTFIGARFARTAFVPADTTSVTIRRTARSWRPRAREHTTDRTVTDPDTVARLVRMVNRLPGAMTTEFAGSCPATLGSRSYTMTFAGPHGTYVASLPTTMCWPRLTLLHDGVEAGPALDPGRTFARTADRFLG